MKLNVVVLETGSSFSVEVDFLGPVSGIKQNIEKSQGIPVAKQTLFFEDKLLQDDQTPSIPDNSSLILSISNDDIPNQNNEQVLQQTDQSPVPSDTIGRTIHGEGQALTAEQLSKNQHDLRPVTTEKRNFGPVIKVEAKRTKDGYSLKELFAPATVGSTRNRNQTEQSSTLDSVKEAIDIPDSPVNKKSKTSSVKLITVMVQAPFEEARFIPVVVNADDNVEELRKELVKLQERGDLNLPQEGFLLKRGQETLTETESFVSNLLIDADEIEIFPKRLSGNH